MGDGPFPAVLLISGSGPQDRNEEIMGHKPFLVLADYLTRRGIAVLRVDDRGVGGSTGKVGVSTIEDHVGDALAGIEFLKSRKEIDAGKIGLVGHSEGGLVAPAAAVKSPDVAFIVLLAGTGVRGDQIVYSQGELIAKSAGASADAIAKNTDLQRKLFAVLKETQDDEQAATQMREVVKAWKEQLTDAERATFDKIEQLLDAQLKTFTNPWFRHFLAYDPKPVLEMVQCPVLAIVGELDLQVPPDENLPAIEAALKKAGNRDYTVKELPGLNHLFQAATTGSPLEYGQIEETFNPAALKVVGDWIAERTKAH
jgi:pimeloyl-ACP methyl ester carboxylesterase